MRLGKVVGTVTPGRIHPLLSRGQLKIVVPFAFSDLTGSEADGEYSLERAKELLMTRTPKPAGKDLVVYDELSAGIGEWVAVSEGAEAAMPFYPEKRPVDAYLAAIIDTLEMDKLS